MLACMALASSAWAQALPDAGKLQRIQLPNGFAVLLLEEHSFPSVSTQMLYRVGARDEQVGQTGLAHFLEHMAFRASANFPDTEVVSRIYAAGGEWHGYTWVDQTTYYSSVPSSQLDLLLRIEADRMQNLLIEPQWLEPEKGAVLAEMHGYENDPSSVLHDAVVFAAFQGHPYRNNVIGWESDIVALQHADVVNFYRRHYVPSNAVLAVVGNFDADDVKQRVGELFGNFPATPPTPLPHTHEPEQWGERRLELLGGGASSHFEIAWRAPAASHPEFAAMLVLQEWLVGGSGVNFMQAFGTTALQPGTALHGKLADPVADPVADVSSWFPPAAQDYLFSLKGSIEADRDAAATEAIIESVLQELRDGEVSDAAVEAARSRVQQQLVFDVGTHEETAHQLAYFDGLGALDAWLDLPNRVAAVTKADLVNLAQRRLQPWQRTIGWYRAGQKPKTLAPLEMPSANPVSALTAVAQPRQMESGSATPANSELEPPPLWALPAPQLQLLDNGISLLLQPNPASRSVYIGLLLRGPHWQGSDQLQADVPLWGLSSLSAEALPGQLLDALAQLLDEAAKLQSQLAAENHLASSSAHLDFLLQRAVGLERLPANNGDGAGGDAAQPISAVVIAGQIDAGLLKAVQQRLSRLGSPPVTLPGAAIPGDDELHMDWAGPLAQAQLGYAAAAPGPGTQDYLAWRALQYILAHDYEGRLGKEAISNQGLAYYLDSQYRSDGYHSWSSITVGVDPAKLDDLHTLFREQLRLLQQQPPTEAEVAEARNHLAGRLLTARQSNAELASGLAQDWFWHGRLPNQPEQLQDIRRISREQVLALVPRFTQGAFAVVKAGKVPVIVTD
jgi:predicted Zn-dependent peptidase